MKKLFCFINIVFASLITICNVCYAELGGLWLKSITSAGFVLLGLFNLIYVIKNNSTLVKYAYFILAALILCMIGDIAINIDFMTGAIIFALGHVFYLISYYVDKKFSIIDIICSLVIFIPSCFVILLVPSFDFGSILMQIICVVYALIISFMLGKSISNFIKERTLANLILMLGSTLFFFSDLMLLLYTFGPKKLVFDTLCVATYYTGQILIAGSLFVKESEKKDKTEKVEEKAGD